MSSSTQPSTFSELANSFSVQDRHSILNCQPLFVCPSMFGWHSEDQVSLFSFQNQKWSDCDKQIADMFVPIDPPNDLWLGARILLSGWFKVPNPCQGEQTISEFVVGITDTDARPDSGVAERAYP